MLTRRDFLQLAAATAAIGASVGGFSRALAQQRLSQEDLLRFEPLGQVTLLHFTDIHAQLLPVHFREPEINLGVGEAKGQPPHVTGAQFLERFKLKAGSAEAFALTHLEYAALAKSYGKIGGLDRMATLVKAIRAARPGRVLLLDGGDTWQGSYTCLLYTSPSPRDS